MFDEGRLSRVVLHCLYHLSQYKSLGGVWKRQLRDSPRSKRLVSAMAGRCGLEGQEARRRKNKDCRVCGRNVNDMDPVQPHKRLRWSYENQITVDPESNEEITKGKVDHYCNKVSLKTFDFNALQRCRFMSLRV